MAGSPLAIGLDIGTGGARAVALDFAGGLVAEGRSDLPADATKMVGPRVEQDPRVWIATAVGALGELAARLPAGSELVGLAVDATSGTFLLADDAGQPLTPGVMYNDLRATAEAAEAAEALRPSLAPYGIEVAAAFALPKLLHFARRVPDVFRHCRRVVHQTDWIVGWLCGRCDVTDVSTALKTGVDPGTLRWPEAIESCLGIPLRLLPEVVLPGTPIGRLTADAAAATGLPCGIPIVAGCTDGTAGCLASGAAAEGELNVTLGSTLVFKAIAAEPLRDPAGVVYNHRHPAGGFLPGAASTTGGEWVAAHLQGEDLDALGRRAAGRLPSGHTAYPLIRSGERFPFVCPAATGWSSSITAAPSCVPSRSPRF